MATFLELCRDVARESGTLAGGTAMPAVEGATGRAEKIVGWVRRAWRNIQLEREDWRWMRRRFEAPLVAGQAQYTPGQMGIARHAAWASDRRGYRPFTLTDPDRGAADEAAIAQIGDDAWRTRYGRGAHDAQRPTVYAVGDDGALLLGATPDKAYLLRGEYRLLPQVLAASDDVPEMPAQFHDVIVHEALRLMGKSDEAIPLIQFADDEVRRARFALVASQLPAVTLDAGPLA